MVAKRNPHRADLVLSGGGVKGIGLVGADQLLELAVSVPYRRFRDSGPIERIPLLGTAWGLARGTGLYRGDFAHQWIRGDEESGCHHVR